MEDRQNGRPSQEHIHHCSLKLKGKKNLVSCSQYAFTKKRNPAFSTIFYLTNFETFVFREKMG